MLTSTSNARVKRLVNLQKKRRLRQQERMFVAEGIRMFREAPAERIKEVYLSESFYKKEREAWEAVLTGTGIQPEVLADHVFDYVSDTKTPQGVLCVMAQKENVWDDVGGGEAPRILVLDNIQDPGNMGTLIRTAEGAGMSGIILSRDCVDIYSPKVIRSTMGAVCRMPFYIAENLPETVCELKKREIKVYAADLAGKHPYDYEDYRGPCAFLIGNEGNGLGKEVAELADIRVRIPVAGQVESLNAAVAAAILMFEAARQRRALTGGSPGRQ